MRKKQNINQYKSNNWFGKSYNFFGDYLNNKYNHRVLKLPINANLSCPNRDGSISDQGCIFCSDDGSASPSTTGYTDIKSQINNAINSFKRSNLKTKYISYFQAYTNTFAPINQLKKLYDEAISYPDIIGLMIGTRPDCLNREIIELISSYKKENFELWLELGMQTIHQKSLNFLNRGHSHQSTLDAIKIANEFNIPICLHLILGIPGETWQDMMQSVIEISKLPIQGVKFHHLHVIKNTPLEKLYLENNFKLLTFKEYISIICDALERLRPDILVHRLSGDREASSLIAPKWGLHKGTVLKEIEEQFKNRGTWQGFLYN